jgi:hypothetical protein
MSHDKQQTALSFFLMGLIDLEIGKGIPTDKVKELHYLFDKAKEMEKEQIIDAYRVGKVEATFPTEKLTTGEQYYNDTYGGNK